MNTLALAAACLLLAAETGKKDPAPSDPSTTLAKSYGGKVWADGEAAPSGADQLKTWLAEKKPAAELARKGPDDPWTLNYLAIFKKAAARGPMTVWFYDKADPKFIVDQCSSENEAASVVSKGSCDLDPDHGFNKGRSYVVKVGQIINGKFQPYAAGEVKLK
jgi:hypothetical protein